MSEEAIWLEEKPVKKKLGTGAKWGIGCGSGCLVLILLVAGVAIFSVFYVKKIVATYETELKGLGFEKVEMAQMQDVHDPVTEPILFKGQTVRIFADCSTNIAVLAQLCEIHGKIEGKLYFRGQLLTIQPKAEITGGLDATAQLVQNHGKVEGGITGKHQLIDTRPRSQPAE
ncbi:MAG: hypothetical protein K9M45_05530 [Kiritimatiellales bacterium]|nr:hypothetical protein [Kiritimatiellales bacterium]